MNSSVMHVMALGKHEQLITRMSSPETVTLGQKNKGLVFEWDWQVFNQTDQKKGINNPIDKFRQDGVDSRAEVRNQQTTCAWLKYIYSTHLKNLK